MEGEACKSPQLELTYLCGYPTDTLLHWYVSNPADVDIAFTWEVIGESESGTGIAKANQETFFTTSKGGKSVRILVEGYQVDLKQGGEACLVTLELDYSCQDNNTQLWTVTNNNKIDQSFTWSSSHGENGSGVVAAGSEFTFTTANVNQEITLEYKTDPFSAQETTASSEVCKFTLVTPTPNAPVTVPVTAPCVDWIVFHTYRDGNPEIYRLDGIEGVGNFKLINLSKNDNSDSSPSRSFDNAWVAFQSNRDGNNEIYVTDSAGLRQIRLTENEGSDINPMFSANNREIAFQSDRNGNWDLYLVDRITGEEVQLTDNGADEINPFFSMDQNWLAFQSNRNGNWDIYILNLETGEEIQVTDDAADEISPAWSPTSRQIAYLKNDNGIWNLYVIDTDGNNRVQITDGNGDTSNQAWSPDGTRLAYQSDRDGNVDIYSYDLRIDVEYRVTENDADDIGPTWDCGGTRLAYTGEKDGNTDIFQVYWKGGTSSHITTDLAIDEWSEWSPAKETASRDE
jgi:Tol biopolymer transport system component